MTLERHEDNTRNHDPVNGNPTRRHVIRRLRRLIPNHAEPMSWREAERVTRAQATLLVRLADRAGADIVDYVASLPVIRVELDATLPDFCTSYWDANAEQWVIIIRASDRLPHRRFSTLNEFKRILDRGREAELYDASYVQGLVQAGMAAEQFANQALMPADAFRDALASGATLVGVARRFRVPVRRASDRMSDLNLLPITSKPERRESP